MKDIRWTRAAGAGAFLLHITDPVGGPAGRSRRGELIGRATRADSVTSLSDVTDTVRGAANDARGSRAPVIWIFCWVAHLAGIGGVGTPRRVTYPVDFAPAGDHGV